MNLLEIYYGANKHMSIHRKNRAPKRRQIIIITCKNMFAQISRFQSKYLNKQNRKPSDTFNNFLQTNQFETPTPLMRF